MGNPGAPPPWVGRMADPCKHTPTPGGLPLPNLIVLCQTVSDSDGVRSSRSRKYECILCKSAGRT